MTTNLTREEQYHLLTGRIFMQVSRFITQLFKKRGIAITKDQWTILAILWEEDMIPQQELASRTGRDKPSVTRLLDHLEKAGYIERIQSEEDKRNKLIRLTPKGVKAEAQVMPVVEEAFQTLTAGMREEQLDGVREVFSKIYANLDEQEKV